MTGSARNQTVLLTGGSGRLGTELRGLLPDMIAPSEVEVDITRPGDIEGAIALHRPRVVVHAAAYTNVAGAEADRATCWRVNVDGTRNVVRAAIAGGATLVHISTDYVFEGTTGGYAEDDCPGPTVNYYALTKLVAEQLVRFAPEHLVIRTSFRPREWPYETAFTDVYTSQDYVDVIAPEIVLAIRHCQAIPYDTIHIATRRKSVYDLARLRRPDVTPASKASVGVRLPDDVSLDITRWTQLKTRWSSET